MIVSNIMEQNRKKQIITQTSDACSNMIVGVRQLRLSVLDLFNTLADGGLDPDRAHQSNQENQQSIANNTLGTGKLYYQQTISNLAASHSLCTASSPHSRVQKQLELKQQSDLIQYVNQMISSITTTIRSLDQDVSILVQNIAHINTGESVHLGMDSSLDKHNLYMDLCSSYKTYSKLHDYSAHCHALLHQQSLKRVHKRLDSAPTGAGYHHQSRNDSTSRSESIVATFNPYIYKICLSKQSVTSMLETCLKMCEYMEGTYSQPFGLSTGVFQISVNRVLKAILVMRGIVIDAVIVKAYHESFASKASRVGSSAGLLAAIEPASGGSQFVDHDDDIDLWSESKYNVFRRLTHHANAAVLHFQYPTYPEIAVRSFLVSKN